MENKTTNINFGDLDTSTVMQTAYGDPIPREKVDAKGAWNIFLYGIILPIILTIVGGCALLKRNKNSKSKKIIILIMLFIIISIIIFGGAYLYYVC